MCLGGILFGNKIDGISPSVMSNLTGVLLRHCSIKLSVWLGLKGRFSESNLKMHKLKIFFNNVTPQIDAQRRWRQFPTMLRSKQTTSSHRQFILVAETSYRKIYKTIVH